MIQYNTQEFFNTYTSKYRPWRLAAVLKCGSVEKEAIKPEHFIKKQKSLKLIEKLIDPLVIPEVSLALLFRVPIVRD